MNISVELKSIRGESAGIPRLILDFRAKNGWQYNLGTVSVRAEIRAAPDMYEHDMRKCPFLGFGELEERPGMHLKGMEQDWIIVLPLSPYALRGIEETRKGRDLFLVVQFFCVATRMDDNASSLSALGRASVYAPGASPPYCPFKVAQSDWVKILKDLGYGDHFLIEVPLRGVPQRVGMKKALAHLEDAWGHFNEGRDEETLVSCYKAFEFLAKQAKVNDPNQQAFGKILAGIEDDKKRKRLELLMDYVCRFFALGRHEEGEETVSLNRRDSEYALILAQASLGYLAKNMSERSKVSSTTLTQSE